MRARLQGPAVVRESGGLEEHSEEDVSAGPLLRAAEQIRPIGRGGERDKLVIDAGSLRLIT